MCQRITCSTCGKPTWTGCGQHVETALRGVAQRDRCQGHEKTGFFARLFANASR